MSRAQPAWLIVPLDSKAHDRTTFACGAPDLDRYIREHASQDVKRNVARAFVALQSGTPEVCGYFSLSAASFGRDNLPSDQAKRLPRYPVPTALLGRLAVDNNSKRKGLGAFLLMDALHRTLIATRSLAVHAVIVDAKNDAARAFYQKYGFIPFSSETRRLFLPMTTICRLARE